MKKIALSSAFMALALLLACGVAFAVTKNCRAGADFCVGTDGPDTLNGSAERDKMYGQSGNDTLRGNGGADLLSGGDENDSLAGAGGDDSFNGGRGNDNMNGGSGDDGFTSGPGNDRLLGGSNPSGTVEYLSDYEGRNFLSGGGGNDDLYGHDRLNGGPGDDEITGSFGIGIDTGPRTIIGGPGEDRIRSEEAFVDTIYVRDGERDIVNCGGGTDTVYFDRGLDSVNPADCERRIAR